MGIVNVACVGVIYVAFHDALKPAEPALTHATTPNSGENNAGGPTTGTGQADTGANGPGSSSQNGQPASAGGSTRPTSGSGSSVGVSSAGGTPSAPSSGPDSLAKGPPCKTGTPPAGVCTAVLSINSQKDGNPYWNPGLLAAIKQQIAGNSYVRTLGLNPTSLYNSVKVSLKESTWKGTASHGTIGGTVSAQGQSQPATFTLDWNGSKWIVNDAVLN